jgi:hypothetical protein
MRAVIVTVVLAASFAHPTDVDAQIAIGVVAGQSSQAEGKSDSPYLGPGFGGSALAGIGMIDVAAGSHVSIGGEASLARDISGIQEERVSSGSNHLVSDHHDSIFSAVVKVGAPWSQRVRASAVVGGGIAQRHTERRGMFQSSITTPPLKAPPVLEVLTDSVWTLTAGVDVAVALADHLNVLAVGRFYQLKDSDLRADGVVHRGVSATIVRYGGGLQIRF